MKHDFPIVRSLLTNAQITISDCIQNEINRVQKAGDTKPYTDLHAGLVEIHEEIHELCLKIAKELDALEKKQN